MNIIIEGQDRCGKTTLVNQLREYLGNSIVIHSSSPPKSSYDPFEWEYNYYRTVAQIAADNKDCSFILDRFHLGVHVYGTKYRKYTADDVSIIFKRTELTLPPNTHLIVLTDYGCKIASRDDGESHEKSVLDYEATRQKFIEAYDMSKLDSLMINISDNGGFQNTLPTVLDFIGIDNAKS